jgi:predicted DNA-binding transcriptional regulator YafY
MFERDKEELRDLGIPVERAPTDVWEIEEGYQIRRDEATVPDLDLTPDEHAALWLAAQAWRGADDSAARALMKLSLAGGEAPAEPPAGWLSFRLEASSPHLPALIDAIADRRRVRFAYRTRGSGEPSERTVEPHSLTYRGGWYLAGIDTVRGAPRLYKLARIAGAVRVEAGRAPQFEPSAAAVRSVPRGPWEGGGKARARIAFSPKASWWVERRTGARPERAGDDGWVELSLPVGDRETFISWVLGFGGDAEVLAPASLRHEVVRRLRRSAGGPAAQGA